MGPQTQKVEKHQPERETIRRVSANFIRRDETAPIRGLGRNPRDASLPGGSVSDFL